MIKPVFSVNLLNNHDYNHFISFLPNKPYKIYKNADTEKKEVLAQTKGLSGIYIWFNRVTNRFYIGSAHNLSKRLRFYYYPSTFKKTIIIDNSLIKYAHAQFCLIIATVCAPSGTVSIK